MRARILILAFALLQLNLVRAQDDLVLYGGQTLEQTEMRYGRGERLYKGGKLPEARTLFKELAAAGYPPAMMSLAYMNEVGEGGPRNPGRAMHWYKAAAAKQMPVAYIKLGLAYQEGKITPRNLVLAYAMFNVAAEMMQPEIPLNLAQLIEEQLSPEQKRLAMTLVYRILDSPRDVARLITQSERIGSPVLQ